MQESTLKRLTRRLFQQKSAIFLVLLGTIFQVALTVYLPILIGQAVNQIVTIHQVDFLGLVGTLKKMTVIVILNALVQWANPLLYNQLVYRMINQLRREVQEKIHRVPFKYIDRNSTGAIVSRITTEMDQLADGLIMVFNQFFIGILTIVITIITMARLDLTMMLIVIGLTPVSIFLAQFIAKRSYQLFTQQTLSRGEHSEMIEESIQETELIRLFNQQESKSEQFKQINDQYSDYSKWAIFYSSTINPTTRFVNAVIYGLVTLVGAMRIIQGGFTVGELTTFLNYANQYMKPFNDISNVLSEIQSALACGDRIFDILDQANEIETGDKELSRDTIEGAIAFRGVDFSYVSGQTLITDLNLSVEPGQTVAIVGPTGAGKSTLINLLMRFYDVDHGEILIDDQNMMDFTRRSIREQFGMVLQETWLKTGTIFDNIAYGHPDASQEAVIQAAKAAHAHRFISMLPDGYQTPLADSGTNLSTGQRQLIAIARIFVNIPEMLILDEATSSIDTRTEVLIQEAFDKLMEGRTTFIIAHRLSTIQNADIILVLKDGNIIEQGDHDTLMRRRGFYFQMQTAGSAEADTKV